LRILTLVRAKLRIHTQFWSATINPDKRATLKISGSSHEELFTMLHRRTGRLAIALLALTFAVPSSLSQKKNDKGQDPSEKQRNVKPELKKAYKDWLDKDVAYIITDEERKAFKKLETDDERERFIEEFWRRRDPDPDTEENEFREEYYERIAYANEHYASGIPGWKT